MLRLGESAGALGGALDRPGGGIVGHGLAMRLLALECNIP